MARVHKITDGSAEVDLIATGTTGMIAEAGGFGKSKFAVHKYDELGDLESRLFSERWSIHVKGSSHDNLAVQTRALWALLRKAWLYHTDPTQTTPVYIQSSTTDETDTRYALVYQAPEITMVDKFAQPFESNNEIESLGIAIARFIWRANVPGDLPTAITLTASDGPASPTKVQVSNFRDDVDVTDFKEDDGGAFSDYSAGDELFPATVAQNDGLLIGSTDQPLHTVVIPALATAGVLTTTTLVLYYWNGAWVALTLGTDYSIFPGADLEASFEQNSDDIVINVTPPSDFVAVAIDGSTAFWYFIREDNASPVYGTNPDQHASNTIYAQSTPYAEIGATVLKGDVPPYVSLRLFTPDGGDENENFASLSRIIIGAKKAPGNFAAFLNAGGDDNPSGWATVQGTDATSTADVRGPAGKMSDVTFATATMEQRVTFTGTAKLVDWVGEYRAYLRAEQEGGTAGDVRVKLRVRIHSSATYGPKFETPVVPTAAADAGIELIELGDIKIPFADVIDSDGFTSADIIFEIHAEDTVGSADLEIFDLILIPTDEWTVELDDPVSDAVNGSSALRGANILEVDGGVLENRTIKYLISGSNKYIAERWGRGGPPPMLEPETQIRLYFIMCNFPTTWGTPPLVSTPGSHLALELYAHPLYLDLIGDD